MDPPRVAAGRRWPILFLVSGGEGDDTIKVRGGRRDRVSCGPGDDTVTASASDRVGKSCETVRD